MDNDLSILVALDTLVPVGAGLLVTGGLVYVVVHFLAKWW